MRVTFFLALTIFGCVAVPVELYNDIYDNTDVKQIIQNDRLFNPYLACLLDKGSCTADGRALKVVLPEAMSTNCVRCSKKQKGIARLIGRYLTEKKPTAWAELVNKYDPERIYEETFRKFLSEDDEEKQE